MVITLESPKDGEARADTVPTSGCRAVLTQSRGGVFQNAPGPGVTSLWGTSFSNKSIF